MDRSKAVKTLVLEEEISYLCQELGDPSRYIPGLRSKNLLDSKDTERIRGQATSHEKVELLIDIIKKREGNESEHPLDILISELKKQRVQVHIARRLQRTLKKKLKESEVETMGASDYEPQMVHTVHVPRHTQVQYESQSSTSESTDSGPSFRAGSNTPQGPSYEINPSVGPIPDPPPPLTAHYSSTNTRASKNVDPEYGLRPGTPPPTSQRHLDDGSLRPGTPPKSSQPSLITGVKDLSLNDHYMNGDSETGGQSYFTSYPSIETDSSLPTLSSFQDTENEKLRAHVQDLEQQLQEEQARSRSFQEQLFSTNKELSFARLELANIKKEYYRLVQSNDVSRQEQQDPPVVRPGTLFPTQYLEHLRHTNRQLSPARTEAKNSTGSQGDNLSIRSANSSTSVNSNSSFGTTPRAQMQSFV